MPLYNLPIILLSRTCIHFFDPTIENELFTKEINAIVFQVLRNNFELKDRGLEVTNNKNKYFQVLFCYKEECRHNAGKYFVKIDIYIVFFITGSSKPQTEENNSSEVESIDHQAKYSNTS